MNFTLVSSGSHHLRYLANAGSTSSPDTGVIQATGTGDADVALEDAVQAGPLKELIDFDTYADQAAARRALMDDGLPPGTPDLTNVRRAYATVVKRSGTFGEWSIDAVENSGRGEYQIQAQIIGAQAYVDIRFRHSLTQQ